MTKIIDGKRISAEIKDELKVQVAQLKEQGVEVTLAVVQVGQFIFSPTSPYMLQ